MASPLESLSEVEAQLEEALGQRARLLAGYSAGVRKAPQLEAVAHRWPQLIDPELLQRLAEEAGTDPAARSGSQRQAAALARGLVEWRSRCSGASAEARGFEALDRSGVPVELEVVAFRDAQHELLTAVDPARRRALAAGIEQAWRAAEPHLVEAASRRWEARSSAQAPLKSPLQWEVLDSWAADLLRLTRDAALDLLAFLARREGVGGRAGGMGWAELTFALEMGSLREHIAPSQLWPLVAHLAEGMGLGPNADGAIALDIEDRPGRAPGAEVWAFAVPSEIALLQRPARTPADVFRLFDAWARAQALAHRPARDSFEARTLADPARTSAAGALIRGVLMEPEWHRRVLRLPSRLSAEMSRSFGTLALIDLRRRCARYLAARELELRGPGDAARDVWRERLAQATGCDASAMGWEQADVWQAACDLRGLSIAVRQRELLVQELDEDYWRNPRAGGALAELWREGGVDLAEGPGSADMGGWTPQKESALMVERASR